MQTSIQLWHDDIRPAPEGWTWARTNDEARTLLRSGLVEAISLDHDMGLHGVELPDDPDEFITVISMRGQSEETGEDLVRWMLRKNLVPPYIQIHSWNPAGAQRMAELLNDAGHSVTVRPFKV